MKIFGKEYNNKKLKKIAYVAVAVALVAWFIFRFVMVIVENRLVVFNPVRDANENGTLVQVITVNRDKGVIKIPLVVKNNRAYVSPSRLGKLKTGQKIGNGKITYVSTNIDLDSGMYVVKTSGVADGLNYVEVGTNGYFVPLYAVRNGIVMISDNGVAQPRQVTVAAQDADVACISSGLQDGDVVILSNVDTNQKINIKR